VIIAELAVTANMPHRLCGSVAGAYAAGSSALKGCAKSQAQDTGPEERASGCAALSAPACGSGRRGVAASDLSGLCGPVPTIVTSSTCISIFINLLERKALGRRDTGRRCRGQWTDEDHYGWNSEETFRIGPFGLIHQAMINGSRRDPCNTPHLLSSDWPEISG
jgi:hypothetical protein